MNKKKKVGIRLPLPWNPCFARANCIGIALSLSLSLSLTRYRNNKPYSLLSTLSLPFFFFLAHQTTHFNRIFHFNECTERDPPVKSVNISSVFFSTHFSSLFFSVSASTRGSEKDTDRNENSQAYRLFGFCIHLRGRVPPFLQVDGMEKKREWGGGRKKICGGGVSFIT